MDMGSRESTEGVKNPKLREKELLSSKKEKKFLKVLIVAELAPTW